MNFKALALAAVFVSGCAAQPVAPLIASSPQQAIMTAADAAPGVVMTTVDLRVNAVGKQNGVTYLNSELDYRDQRNISVVIAPAVLEKVEALFGGALDQAAAGKHIVVNGPTQRVTIWFFDKAGKKTDKYYYQTHIVVSDPSQIRLL